MSFSKEFKKQLFNINEKNFVDNALHAFEFQFKYNTIYQSFCNSLAKTPKNVKELSDIPFLPVELFKNHAITSTTAKTEKIFKSSGTTSSSLRSQHQIPDLKFYHQIARRGFEDVFGGLSEKTVLAMLPSYIEQGDSSLISMVDSFIKIAKEKSGYYPSGLEDILEDRDAKYILFGVSYALLDLKLNFNGLDLILIETGGMKGRRKEITREELHQIIKNQTGIEKIWSEYGMTELQSQAYGLDGHFSFPPWGRVLIREVNDPFSYLNEEKIGGINIIDLANIETCSFIETKDLGKLHENGTFEVLGRFDNSEIRGCNLLI